MFVLRRITPDAAEVNTCISDSYNYVTKERNQKDYSETLADWLKGLDRGDDDLYGFITFKGGQKIIPLYLKSVYFIMMSDGQTFANITKY